MQNTNTSIALESLKILEGLSDRSWAAYPVSLLPHPKEVTRQAILEYFKAQGKNLEAIEADVMVYRYGLLAYFINDEDAALVNSMAIRDRADSLMQQVHLIKTVALPKVLASTDVFQKYLGLTNQIATENARLRIELRSVLEAADATSPVNAN